ncbi:hypothetical protein BJV78DRAFT_1141102, partial [Lactifluus subvellereus]
LMNLWDDHQEGLYAIRHNRQVVNPSPVFPRGKNLAKKAFPLLYPYGRGGIEANRTVHINFKEHIKWSLRYFNRRLRKHAIFPFFAFGIAQRREALFSARLRMKRQTFEREARLLSTVTKEKLELTRVEEKQKIPISDPAVRLLRRAVQGVMGHVTGSNETRQQMSSQIWSTSVYLGPPALWITINPSGINNPIAQLFADASIVGHEGIHRVVSEPQRRAELIADDPYAAAHFFHFSRWACWDV